MVSFSGVKISLYCFSSAFNIALSTLATAYKESARPVNASEYIEKGKGIENLINLGID